MMRFAQTMKPGIRLPGDTAAQSTWARDEFGVVQNSGDGFHVADLAAANPTLEIGEGENARRDAFVLLGARDALLQSLGEKNHHVFLKEARGREKVSQFAHSPGGVTGFFGELAVRAFQKILTVIFPSGHQLPKELLGGVAVLANHEDAAVVKHR